MAANFINYTLLINRSYLLCEERCLIVGNLQERLKYRSRSFTGTLSLWWRRCANYENHFTFQAPLSSRKFLKVVAKESRGRFKHHPCFCLANDYKYYIQLLLSKVWQGFSLYNCEGQVWRMRNLFTLCDVFLWDK